MEGGGRVPHRGLISTASENPPRLSAMPLRMADRSQRRGAGYLCRRGRCVRNQAFRFLASIRDFIMGAAEPDLPPVDALTGGSLHPDDARECVEEAWAAAANGEWGRALSLSDAALRAELAPHLRLTAEEVRLRVFMGRGDIEGARRALQDLLTVSLDGASVARANALLLELQSSNPHMARAVKAPSMDGSGGILSMNDAGPADEVSAVEEPDPFATGGPGAELSTGGGLELPHLADSLHLPVGSAGEDDTETVDPQSLPFLDVDFAEPTRVHRFVVAHPGMPAREILRRFAEAEARRRSPEDIFRLYHLGVAFLQMGQWEEAITLLLPVACADSPDRIGGVEALARSLFELGRVTEAHAYLIAALPPSPRDPALAGIFFWLGQVAEERGDPRNAMVYYAHAVELQPDLMEARGRLRILLG